MELVLLLHREGCSVTPSHMPCEYNTWADELTHPDFQGFDAALRLGLLIFLPFSIAPRLLAADAFTD